MGLQLQQRRVSREAAVEADGAELFMEAEMKAYENEVRFTNFVPHLDARQLSGVVNTSVQEAWRPCVAGSA